MRGVLSRVFRYGVATVRCDKDVAADLRGAIASPKVKHFAAITKPADVGALLRAIDGYMRLCNRIDDDRSDEVLSGIEPRGDRCPHGLVCQGAAGGHNRHRSVVR